MCGIFGLLGNCDFESGDARCNRLFHRGPDAVGVWQDTDAHVWIGHRRLSIVDLSEAGAQPMVSSSGCKVITYNGEIFNHGKLRDELSVLGQSFRGHSDTEVILASIEQWGLEEAIQRFTGFFAFALWDRESRCLTLVRDRVGIKPLYYAQGDGQQFAFSSELHALHGLRWIDQSIDFAALSCYFRYLAVSPPATIFRGMRSLLPGQMLEWNGREAVVKTYWSVAKSVRDGTANPFQGSFTQAADSFEELLTDAVTCRMMADVPIGAFLSGGVDSSLIVAMMRKSGPVKTFSIAFDDERHDESAYADAVARHLGTEHTVERFTAGQMLELVQRMPEIHDEPFADVSSLPTFLLSSMTRKHVTVALSGDGGDELFGGYPRYFWANRIMTLRNRLGPIAPLVAKFLGVIPRFLLDGPLNAITQGRYAGSGGLAHRVRRFAEYLSAQPEDVYRKIISAWPDPGMIFMEPLIQPMSKFGAKPEAFGFLSWAEQMMATDQVNYMVDDILTKVDRTSMAVSLEVRVPLLDHRIVEFAWRLPACYKLASSGDRGKLLMREVLYRYVPQKLIERPKMGFGVPLNKWLRGPLKEWASDLLCTSNITADGILNPVPIQKAWNDCLSGKDRALQLWTVLMFLQWRTARSAKF